MSSDINFNQCDTVQRNVEEFVENKQTKKTPDKGEWSTHPRKRISKRNAATAPKIGTNQAPNVSII